MGGPADLSGYTVGVTATRGGDVQAAQLARLGVAVVHAPVSDAEPALRLVDLVCTGAVDALTFTAGPDVRNFMAWADRSRRGRNVLSALNGGAVVACAGPACAAVAVEEGINRPLHTDRARTGPLVRLVARELAGRRLRYRVGACELVLQGSLVLIDGRPARLTERERAVLVKLAEHPGATVSRRVLLRHVWKDPSVDPAELERAVSGLRSKLGLAAAGLDTAPGRGYRLWAVETPT
jgi:uroporphyrinogen-III synthase